jgi:maleate isomerase
MDGTLARPLGFRNDPLAQFIADHDCGHIAQCSNSATRFCIAECILLHPWDGRILAPYRRRNSDSIKPFAAKFVPALGFATSEAGTHARGRGTNASTACPPLASLGVGSKSHLRHACELAATGQVVRLPRARIGYTSPPLTTEVFPYEFYKIVPEGVTLVITSSAIVVRSKEEVDQSYDISMRAAREMAAAGCDIVVLGGVPINLSRGSAGAEQMVADLEAELNVKVSTSTSAQTSAAKALGCKKVVVAQPYAHADTERIAGYARHFGCEVLGATGWGSPFNQIGRIPQHAALELGRRLMREHPDADSILLPSPHWPTAGAVEPLEREFGVNVMTAHQAIVWDALRRCGVKDRIEGFGRLFRDF